eukprot:1652048-Pyramimonas_sp.AAC.1
MLFPHSFFSSTSSFMRPRPRARKARLPRPLCTRKLCEFPAVAKVDGLPPAPSWQRNLDGSFA